MGDQQDRHALAVAAALFGLQVQQQLHDACADGHVQGGGRFVGDQQPGPAGQGHGDHRALQLAARELVREAVDPPLGVADAGAGEQGDGLGTGLAG
ncbi:hypothetical protein D3C85_1703480 [compost metagenome]